MDFEIFIPKAARSSQLYFWIQVNSVEAEANQNAIFLSKAKEKISSKAK